MQLKMLFYFSLENGSALQIETASCFVICQSESKVLPRELAHLQLKVAVGEHIKDAFSVFHSSVKVEA